jgi:hypothetical protein
MPTDACLAAFPAACREEGLRAFWKGNGVQIIRIFPYSAGQLMSNDMYKRLLANQASRQSLLFVYGVDVAGSASPIAVDCRPVTARPDCSSSAGVLRELAGAFW